MAEKRNKKTPTRNKKEHKEKEQLIIKLRLLYGKNVLRLFFFSQKSSLKVLGSCCEIATMRETWRSVREALLHQTSFQKEFEKKADSEMTVREMLLKHNRLSRVTKLFQSLQYTGSPPHWILQCLSMREWARTSRDTGWFSRLLISLPHCLFYRYQKHAKPKDLFSERRIERDPQKKSEATGGNMSI